MNCWDAIDKIYCISLEHRTDRRKLSGIEFGKVGLLERVEYVRVRPHDQNSEQGIFESHLRCFEMGLAAGARRMAIFEDDVVFDGFDPQRVEESLGFVERLDHWDFLFLGCLVSRSRPTATRVVRRVGYRSLTHGYVLNRPFAEQLVEIQWSGRPIDAIFRDLAEYAYAVYPSVAFQSSASTDNWRLKRLDRVRRMCGGLRFIQKMNERYHRHFKVIVLAHLVAALALVGWLLLPAVGFFTH
jgi:GR25 family glycosyltransferase involved in LPS biosynthesis